MHMRGTPRTMQHDPRYDDVVARGRRRTLRARVDAAVAAGVARDAILADPGIGFGKTVEHNLALLRALPELAARVGRTAARRHVAQVVPRHACSATLPVDARDEATLATTVWCFEHGAAVVRVHDVAVVGARCALLDALERATPTA